MSLCFLSFLFFSAFALNLDGFQPPRSWRERDRAHPSEEICIHLAVKQDPDALRQLDEIFWNVSNPVHAQYGQYLTHKQMRSLMSTELQRKRSKLVANWVTDNVNLIEPILVSVNDDFVRFCTTIGDAEKFFKTRFFIYHHFEADEPDPTEIARSKDPITVPDHIAEVLDFIGGANAPIHHPAKRQLSNAETYVNNVNIDTAGKKPEAPVLKFVTPGDTEIAAGWQIFCKNGEPNTDWFSSANPTGSLCASNPPTITSFEFLMEDQDNDTKVLTALPRSCARGKGAIINNTVPFYHPVDDPSYCTVVAGNVRMYLPQRITIRTHFSDGTLADSFPSAPVFALDFATPDFLRRLYDIPDGARAVHPENSQAVAEFLEQYYNPDDLDIYMDMMGLKRESVYQIVGPNNATEGSINGGEAQLDIQVILGLAPGAKTWFWSVPGRDELTEEPFIKWLMDLSEMEKPPLVHSVSYADAEDSMPREYTDRLNVEFKKLGARGLTLLFASGDDGASGADDCNVAEPEFPSSSPYVTSVGATQLTDKGTPICLSKWRGVDIATTKRERVCSADYGGVITSGGGFSARYRRPYYQDNHVQSYLAHPSAKLPPKSFYEEWGRGFPDISAYGNNFVVIMGGNVVRMSGTSASTPVVAAMITLWNDIRLSNNKPPLGFINPLLYHIANKHPEAFIDVVIGDNRCPAYNHGPCCPFGFPAATGWDAVTGLGSPNFRTISSYLMGKLPNFETTRTTSTPSVPFRSISDKPPSTGKGNPPVYNAEAAVAASNVTAPLANFSVGFYICLIALMVVFVALIPYIFRNKRTQLYIQRPKKRVDLRHDAGYGAIGDEL